MRTGHLTLFEAVLPPSGEWTAEFAGWCFARVIHGYGYVLRSGAAHQIEAGHVIVSCVSHPLVFRASQIGEMKLLYFRLCPELLAGFFTLHEEHYLQTVAPRGKPSLRLFTPPHPVTKQFSELGAQSAAGNCLLNRGRMLALVVHVLNEELAEHPARPHHRNDAGVRFQQVIAAMPAAEIQNCSLTELARQCGCSERHFSRLFRAHFGFSVRAKQMEMRLQRALQLLRESDAKIMYVAIESGFRHLGLFNAMFKRRFGMTPSEWRERMLGSKRPKRSARLALHLH